MKHSSILEYFGFQPCEFSGQPAYKKQIADRVEAIVRENSIDLFEIRDVLDFKNTGTFMGLEALTGMEMITLLFALKVIDRNEYATLFHSAPALIDHLSKPKAARSFSTNRLRSNARPIGDAFEVKEGDRITAVELAEMYCKQDTTG